MRPFDVVNDHEFQCLIKTGRLEHYLPSPSTVSRDVKRVFVKARIRMAKMLQVSADLVILLNFSQNCLTCHRSMREPLVSEQTRGRHPTTKRSLPSLCISKSMARLYLYF